MHAARKDEMRSEAFASLVFLVLLVFILGVRAQRSDTATATSPAWNDNSLITVQKHGGDPARPGDVRIEFYGHDAFKITSPKGLTVLMGDNQNSRPERMVDAGHRSDRSVAE